MFESLTLLTITIILFFAWQNKQLGLTSTVPKEPGARAHWQASQCLETFKNGLSGSTVKSLAAQKIVVAPKNAAEVPLAFWCEAGKVFRQLGDGKAEQIHFLGPAGSLEFRLLSAHALFAKITADSGSGAHHEVGVRVEVQAEGVAAQPA